MTQTIHALKVHDILARTVGDDMPMFCHTVILIYVCTGVFGYYLNLERLVANSLINFKFSMLRIRRLKGFSDVLKGRHPSTPACSMILRV